MTALWTHSNRFVQIRLGLELTELLTPQERKKAHEHKEKP